MSKLRIEKVEGAIKITVKVVPGSSRTAIGGIMGESLKVKVAAPPEKGKANKALIDFLAKKAGVKRGNVSIAAGQTSEIKQVVIKTDSADLVISKILA